MEQFLAAHTDAIGAVIATIMVFLVARVPAWITGKSTLSVIAQSAWRQFMVKYSTVQPKDAMGTFKKIGDEPGPAVVPASALVDTEAPTDPGHKGAAGGTMLLILFRCFRFPHVATRAAARQRRQSPRLSIAVSRCSKRQRAASFPTSCKSSWRRTVV